MKEQLRHLIKDEFSGEWGELGTAEDGVPVIRTLNFNNDGTLDLSDLAYRKITAAKVEAKRLRPGDTIIEKSGGGPNQPVGRVVYYNGPEDLKILCNNFTSVLRPDPQEVDPLFFNQLLRNNHRIGRTRKYQNKTIGIINLRLKQYLSAEVDIPDSVDDQRRIAALLSRAEGLIAQRKESLRLLDELVRSVFLEMFGDPARNEKGWRTEPLGKILEQLENGWSPVCEKDPRISDTEWAVLKLGAVSWKRFNDKENKKLPLSETPRESVEVRNGDLLVTRKNTRDLVGTAAYVFTTPPGLLLPDLIFRLEPKPKTIHKIFLCHVLNHPSMRPRIANLSSGSASSMPNISMEKLRTLRVPVPDWNLQTKFAQLAEETEKLREGAMKLSAEYLEQLYGSLSQRAFRGVLDVHRVGLIPPEIAHLDKRPFIVLPPTVPGGNASIGPTASEKKTKRKQASSATLQGGVFGLVSGEQFKPEYVEEVVNHMRVGRKMFRFEDFKAAVDKLRFKYVYADLRDAILTALDGDDAFLEQVFDKDEQRDGYEEAAKERILLRVKN